MSSTEATGKMKSSTKFGPVDRKLEVVLLGVSDVDRAKAFYENLGWRVDIDSRSRGDAFPVNAGSPRR